jgi:hypothetical protein
MRVMAVRSGALLGPRPRTPLIVGILLCASTPALSQVPDSGGVPPVPATAARRAERLDSARYEAAARFVAVAEEVLRLRTGDHGARTRLLAEGQRLAERIDGLDLEMQFTGLVSTAASPGRSDPLAQAMPTLRALAAVVAEEQHRLRSLHRHQDELRLFLGTLRLFDETGMPPSSRGDASGDPDPGCPVTACPITGGSPADVPLAHFQPGAGADTEGAGAAPVTVTSLARLQAQIHAHTGDVAREGATTAPETVVTRETVLGAGAMGFRGDGRAVSGAGPKVWTTFLIARPLGATTRLMVEPALGGRGLRVDPSTVAELAGELRTTLAGAPGTGGVRWQLLSWQKARFLSDPLPAPGYLDPGRAEGGLAGHLAIPVHGAWTVELRGGGDLVRYGPEEWKILDRHGLNAAAAMVWRDTPVSARISLLGSRHAFGRSASTLGTRREDTRVGLEADASLDGRAVLRASAGMAWNQSPIPAYDFRTQRLALALALPRGNGSVQAYGALAHQTYLNPGSEDARVAPSDHDTGSTLALQYTLPLDARRVLAIRAEWSRSVTGFRDDFYQRVGVGVQIGFRSLGGV